MRQNRSGYFRDENRSELCEVRKAVHVFRTTCVCVAGVGTPRFAVSSFHCGSVPFPPGIKQLVARTPASFVDYFGSVTSPGSGQHKVERWESFW